MGLVDVERRAISERHDETGIVGARRSNDILADLQRPDALDVAKGAQAVTVTLPRGGVHLRLVPETYDVNQRHTPLISHPHQPRSRSSPGPSSYNSSPS